MQYYKHIPVNLDRSSKILHLHFMSSSIKWYRLWLKVYFYQIFQISIFLKIIVNEAFYYCRVKIRTNAKSILKLYS